MRAVPASPSVARESAPTPEVPSAGPPPRGRRRALPWAVLALWILVLAVAAPFAGKLGDVQRDSVVDYLPANADSTQVATVQQRLPGGESTDLVLVYHRDAGLTAADRRTAERQIAAVAAAHRLTDRGTPVAVPSEDGTTLMVPVSTTEPGSDEDARAAFVDGVRKTVSSGLRADGLSVEVGGPGALRTDTTGVFETLDGTLMIATVLVVAVLLILTYRSPFLWLVPLAVVGVAAFTARALVYGVVQGMDLTVTSQSAGIMTVLVFGAGTDYALLLVARYREELRRTPDVYDAMRAALRGSGPAVLASSGTVALGLLCLLAADLNNMRGLGPVGAVGVLCALAAMLTLLPAVLVLLGRRVFWPLVPAYGADQGRGAGPGDAARRPSRRSLFAAMGGSAGRRPAVVLAAGAVLLGALALGMSRLPGTLTQADSFIDRPESVSAMRTLADAYPERGSQPIALTGPTAGADRALERARTTEGVASAEPGRSEPSAGGTGRSEIIVFAKDAPQTAGETRTIEALRAGLRAGGGADDWHVGGPSAQQLDLDRAGAHDRKIVMPLVLAVVLLILIALLRSLVAPLVLVVAVVAVWGAAMGLGGLVFGPVLGFGGVDRGLPLLSFVFLVALGVDYGIFLMHRIREEALSGAEPAAAALTALRTTGGVIASAGIVLAATFAVLMSLPLVMMAELGFVVGVGVLLDTFLVRTYLVTSAAVLLGRRMWWPGALRK
ncbi:MMPL family transporter [Streptomyces paludis]|uniref:MMPL family transporter n=1 Tax=Streptomyces paludis TaxID=2282738 RepID=A0A345HM41_9ACTN|nr:MMPL family transporter [Streptomyces paludis]AXG77765.1 MMPL family transporter [Streptomyces paludis]